MQRHSMRVAFVLTLLLTGAAQPVAAQQPTPEHDTVFWESIRDSSAPEEFEAYLDLFPDGIFRITCAWLCVSLGVVLMVLEAALRVSRLDFSLYMEDILLGAGAVWALTEEVRLYRKP